MAMFKNFITMCFAVGVLSSVAFANESIQQLNSGLPVESTRKSNLVISSFMEIPTHSFLISTDAGRVGTNKVGQRIQYNPTFGPNVGIGGTYEFWSLQLSKRLSFLNQQDIQTYGKSDYVDWRVGYKFTPTFSVESYYQNYHGFYTDLSGQEGLQTTVGTGASAAFTGTNGPSQIVNRPDISALNYGLRATYAFPLMPIFNAVTPELEAQASGWDFNILTKAYYNRLAITGDHPLVPAATASSFSPIASLKEYWSNTLGVGAGLGAVVPISKKTNFGFDAMLGAGFQRQTNVFVDHESVAYTTAQEMNANLYTDWKDDAHGVRVGFYWDTFSSKVDDVNLDTSNLGLNLVYSYHGASL